MQALALDLLRVLALGGLMLATNILGPGLTTALLLVLWLPFAALAARALWRSARSRRSAFLHACVADTSPWRRHLRGGPLMLAAQLPAAMLFATVLLTGLLRLESDLHWWLLAGTLPATVLLYHGLCHLLRDHIGAHYLPELSLRLTRVAVLVLALPPLALLAAASHYPELGNVPLDQAILHEAIRQEAASPTASLLMQLAAAKDATIWWLGQRILPVLGQPTLQIAGWSLLLGTEGLFLWSLLITSCGILAHPPRPRQER